MPRRRSRGIAELVVAVVLSLVGAACGEDNDQAGGNPARYCELTAELDRKGEAAFGSLGEDAPPETFAAAARHMLETNSDLVRELEATAPRAIKSDVSKLLAAQRELANGDLQAPDRVSKEDERVNAWEEKNCS